ncbi:RNA polymerase sigma factor [Nocardia sp. NBC_01499]|uniref:RNA polymerase sigma factor n=1 Tax=Nocardia sp. NBC_01499 TaxID=2903597 RepID=UPI0038670D21
MSDETTLAERAVADAHRREWATVLAVTVRITRDLDLAEECVQDAYVAALRTWTSTGIPAKPGAWLTTVARRNALNAVHRERILRGKLPLLVDQDGQPDIDDAVIPDDRLRLIFTCCHPALMRAAQVALTLRLVCGVSTAEIAEAFLVSTATMAARITRAKTKIAVAAIPYRIPDSNELPQRLQSVLTVVHLLYTSGHTARTGVELVRIDLVERAIDLARMLYLLLPDQGEVLGLLALLLVNHARHDGRTDARGDLVTLEQQDRRRWDRGMIDEGHQLIITSLRSGPPGRFTLQAAIAALHAQAPSFAETDWSQIVTLYDQLLETWPSPVVALNRAISISMLDGPAAGLAEIQALEQSGALNGYHYLPAAKADMLRRLGRRADAGAAYSAALASTDNAAEQRFLAARLAECGTDSPSTAGAIPRRVGPDAVITSLRRC